MFGPDNRLDCGYCAIGWACGVSRDIVALADPNPRAGEGLHCGELRTILERLGRLERYRFYAEHAERRRLDTWRWQGGRWIVLIRRAGRAVGHYIVIEDGWIADSDAMDVLWPLDAYPMRDWRVIGWWKVRVTESDGAGVQLPPIAV